MPENAYITATIINLPLILLLGDGLLFLLLLIQGEPRQQGHGEGKHYGGVVLCSYVGHTLVSEDSCQVSGAMRQVPAV